MDTIKMAFWEYSTQLTELIVPIICIYILFRIVADLLLGGRS